MPLLARLWRHIAMMLRRSIAIAAFREIRDVMGERIGSRWRDTVEHNSDKAAIVVDIPHAKPEPDLPN